MYHFELHTPELNAPNSLQSHCQTQLDVNWMSATHSLKCGHRQQITVTEEKKKINLSTKKELICSGSVWEAESLSCHDSGSESCWHLFWKKRRIERSSIKVINPQTSSVLILIFTLSCSDNVFPPSVGLKPEAHMHHVRYEGAARQPAPCQAKTDSSAHSAWWAPTARCPSASWPAPSSQHQTPACVGTKQLTLSLSLPSPPLSHSVQSFTQTYVPYQPYTQAYLHKHMRRGTHFCRSLACLFWSHWPWWMAKSFAGNTVGFLSTLQWSRLLRYHGGDSRARW